MGRKLIKPWIFYWLDYTLKQKYGTRIRVKNPDDPQKYLAIGISILKKFYHQNLSYRTGELPKPEVEKRFSLIFKGHRVTGVIDRIQPIENNGTEIWDYKTGYKKPTEQELALDAQFTLYNLAWLKKTGKNPIRMRLCHLSSGEQLVIPIRNESDYVQLGRWLDEAMVYVQNILEPQFKQWKDFPFRFLNPEDIERQYFSPRPSSFCGLCDYDELCQAYQPEDPIREKWIKQELDKISPDLGHIQLELSFPKTKRKSLR